MVKAKAHLQRQDDRVDRWSAAWPQPSLRRFVLSTTIAVRYGARYRPVVPVFTQSAYQRSTGNGRHWRLFCRTKV
jgi:hypothetical protein